MADAAFWWQCASCLIQALADVHPIQDVWSVAAGRIHLNKNGMRKYSAYCLGHCDCCPPDPCPLYHGPVCSYPNSISLSCSTHTANSLCTCNLLCQLSSAIMYSVLLLCHYVQVSCGPVNLSSRPSGLC